MNKEELKNLIRESINELENENADRIIRESVEHDARMLCEYREKYQGLVEEGVITESELEEGFFDTVKNFGKNAIGSVADAWKKAKDQGNEEEATRLAAKMKKTKAGAKAGKAGETGAAKKPLQPGDHGYTKAYAKKIGSKVADTSGVRGKRGAKGGATAAAPQPAKQPSAADKKTAAVKSAAQILKKMEKDDPKGLEKLKQYMSDPNALQQLLNNPKIQQSGQEAKQEIAQEKKPGLLQKVTNWAYGNPVKAALGVGAIAAIAGAIAVPGVAAGTLLLAAAQAAGIQFAGLSIGGQLMRSAGVDPATNKRLPKTENIDTTLEEELDKKIEEISYRKFKV